MQYLVACPQVEVQGQTSCPCRVALAAAQEGLCDSGEQLLVTPYGYGVCGCIVDPPHVEWPADGICYPVYSRGPCEQGFQLRFGLASEEPVCLPKLCQEGQVLYEVHEYQKCSFLMLFSIPLKDGECYQLGSRGPCSELHILSLSPDTLSPICNLNTSKV